MEILQTFYLFWVFVFGLTIGSFLNVVILRGFSGESIVLPPSKCPHCLHKLAPWDNIPVLSFLILGGKCRYCHEKISIQYPLVELFTALSFTWIFYKYGLSFNSLFITIAAALCIIMAVCDILEKEIFEIHAYLLGGLGIIYNLFNFAGVNHTKIHLFLVGHEITIHQSFIYSLLGLIFGVIFMEALSRIPKLFIGKRVFGEGDSYIAGALGAFFGISNLLVILILSFIVQGLIVVPIFLWKLFKTKQYKLLVSMLLFVVLAVMIGIGNYFGGFRSDVFYYFALALLICIGYYCCRNIFTTLKNTPSQGLTYVPFGPALIIGAFIIIFFGI